MCVVIPLRPRPRPRGKRERPQRAAGWQTMPSQFVFRRIIDIVLFLLSLLKAASFSTVAASFESFGKGQEPPWRRFDMNMTSTSSNSHPDGAREETEGSCEREAGEERVSSTSAELICLAQDDNGSNDTAEISAFLGQRERAKGGMTSVPQPPSSVPNISSAAVDVEGRASTSSASAGL
ncbi:hypothetical protein THAOC_36406, partial [Thalassiosira oceanica]